MSRWEIRVEEPDLPARTMEAKPGLTFGRHPDNAVVLADVKTSGFHGELRDDAQGRLLYVDLGSTNKTRVEGGPVLGRNEGVPLADGLRLFIGKTAVTVIDRAKEDPKYAPTMLLEDSEDPAFAAQLTIAGGAGARFAAEAAARKAAEQQRLRDEADAIHRSARRAKD